LQFRFPGVGTTTVATAGIGQNEQLAAAIVAIAAVAFPPTGDRMGGASRRVMRGTYEDGTPVGEQVVDAIRDRDADGIGTEIMIVDAHGGAIPLNAIVFGAADQFSFLGIDADDGKPLALKAGSS